MQPPPPLKSNEIGLLGSVNEADSGYEDGDLQSFKWPRSLCSVDSLGNIYASAAKAQYESDNKKEKSGEKCSETKKQASPEKDGVIEDEQVRDELSSGAGQSEPKKEE